MTSRLLVISFLLLIAGCSSENDSSITDRTDEVQLVDGQAVCDSCASVRIVLAGPGTANVTQATLVTSGAVRTPVPARIVLTRASGAAGDVLVVNAYFDAGIAEGEFDLWLDPVNDADARVVPGALLVTRARPGPGELAVVRVWVQLSGIDLDGRFAFRTVSGCQTNACVPAPVEAYAATALEVPPGTYTFQLDDVASNCTLGGTPNPSTVTLKRGEVTSLTYRVSCTRSTTPGWVRIANRTTGVTLDDNYLVSCSTYTCLPFKLISNRDTVLQVVPGELSIRIGEVAAHCTLSGAATLVLMATAGDTVSVSFNIDCGSVPGIRVTIRATGSDIGPGVGLTVCGRTGGFGCSSLTASLNEVVLFPALAPGIYDLYVGGLADNCELAPGSPSSAEVTNSTVDLALEVTCRVLGTVRVTATTTGTNPDLSYMVVSPAGCDDYYVACQSATLPSSGSVDMRVAGGTRSFELRDVASNCAVTAPSNPATIAVIEGGLVELPFKVACR